MEEHSFIGTLVILTLIIWVSGGSTADYFLRGRPWWMWYMAIWVVLALTGVVWMLAAKAGVL